MEEPKCDICDASLVGKESYDLVISVTTYDDEGDPVKTLQELSNEDVSADYFVIGVECCGDKAVKLWRQLTAGVNAYKALQPTL